MIRVQTEDFDAGAEMAALTRGRHNVGALTVFVGLVRDMAGDSRVNEMELEHYPGMTEKMLERIEAQARERWPLDDTLIIHRHGPLGPGDQIVMVACTSPHRQASFEACEFLIDWLKTKAPFWKKEQGPDGEARWVEARGSDDQAAARWETGTDG